MSEALEMAERHRRALARLTELGLALAERAQEQALAAMDAGDPKAVADLSLTFHRVSRNVRQSIALEAKLVRDAARAEREAAAEAERQHAAALRDPAAMARRKAAVQAAVEKIIWTEREGEEADDLLELLEAYIAVDGFDDDLYRQPLDLHIARLCADLGLSGPEPGQPPATHSPPPDTG